jgi:hypothetical protein
VSFDTLFRGFVFPSHDQLSKGAKDRSVEQIFVRSCLFVGFDCSEVLERIELDGAGDRRIQSASPSRTTIHSERPSSALAVGWSNAEFRLRCVNSWRFPVWVFQFRGLDLAR